MKFYNKVSINIKELQLSFKSLTTALKIKGIKKSKVYKVILNNYAISCEFENEESSIPCKTGFDDGVEICINSDYLKKMIERDHDFELWIAKEKPHAQAVHVIDDTFGTTELTMPMFGRV